MYFNSVELNAGFDQFRVLISTLFKRFSVNTSCVDWIIIYIIIYYLLNYIIFNINEDVKTW